MTQDLDDDVVRRMCAGDTDAFRQVLDHHLGQILAYVRRFLPMAPAADIEDIAQDTFIRLWTSRQSFDPDRVKVTTWLHRIAHNLCIDHLRQQQRFEAPAPPLPTDGPEQAMEDRDRATALACALMELPERQRSALVLVHYQGLAGRQAAEILDISIDALESLLRRSRSKLKQLLQAQL